MTDHLIRTTMRPDQIVSVNDEELADLTRMGVVASIVPSDLSQVPAPTPLVGKTSAKGESDGGEEEGQPEADGEQEARSGGG